MRKKVILYIVLVFFVFSLIGIRAPDSFPKGDYFVISKGSGLSSVANSLAEKHVIRSAFLFKLVVVASGNQGNLASGVYIFKKPLNLIQIASRITTGEYGLTPIKVTIPEGTTVVDVGRILEKYSISFKYDEFIKIAKKHEGYLFPDTYYILPSVSAEEVVDMMLANFDRRVAAMSNDLKVFAKPLTDVIKMASILEEEARTTESRRIIAGILWKRISIGMPLQVDVTFAYIEGKKKGEDISLEDLKIDSPYNLYLYRGLPPTPITNPGIDSISSAITPIKTPYLYYLSDKKGEMHYARTFEEHVANKNRYLR